MTDFALSTTKDRRVLVSCEECGKDVGVFRNVWEETFLEATTAHSVKHASSDVGTGEDRD